MMNKLKINIVLVILFLVALSGFASAEDLSDFPDIFVDNGNLDVIIVVGDKASASHAIAQAQVALSLTSFIDKRVLGLTKLASEVDGIEDVNIISIGNACNNEVTSLILGNPSPCDAGLEKGKATIEFFESEDRFHIVLSALSDEGIKKAADVLSNYESYELEDDVFEIIVIEEEEKDKEEVPIIIDDVEEVIKVKEPEAEKDPEEKIEFEESKPELILKDEDNLIFKIVSWFRSLFGK